jgi:hypothetical protein
MKYVEHVQVESISLTQAVSQAFSKPYHTVLIKILSTIQNKWDLSLYNLNFKISRHLLLKGERSRVINSTIYLLLIMYFLQNKN